MTNSAKTSPPLPKSANTVAAASAPRAAAGPTMPGATKRGAAEELSDKASSTSGVAATTTGAGGDASGASADGSGMAWWDLSHFASEYSQPVALGAVLLLGLCVGLLVGTRRHRQQGLLGGTAYRQLGGPAVESWHWPVA